MESVPTNKQFDLLAESAIDEVGWNACTRDGKSHAVQVEHV